MPCHADTPDTSHRPSISIHTSKKRGGGGPTGGQAFGAADTGRRAVGPSESGQKKGTGPGPAMVGGTGVRSGPLLGNQCLKFGVHFGVRVGVAPIQEQRFYVGECQPECDGGAV